MVHGPGRPRRFHQSLNQASNRQLNRKNEKLLENLELSSAKCCRIIFFKNTDNIGFFRCGDDAACHMRQTGTWLRTFLRTKEGRSFKSLVCCTDVILSLCLLVFFTAVKHQTLMDTAPVDACCRLKWSNLYCTIDLCLSRLRPYVKWYAWCYCILILFLCYSFMNPHASNCRPAAMTAVEPSPCTQVWPLTLPSRFVAKSKTWCLCRKGIYCVSICSW